MRWRDLRNRRRADQDATMTPMIDVVFLLLIYFLWTASFQIAEFDLPVSQVEQLGAEQVDIMQPPPPEADYEDIVVRLLDQSGTILWTVNDSPVSTFSEVQATLKQIWEVNPDATVIVHPDKTILLGSVIETYDAARAVGFDSVSFAATPET